MKKLIKSLAALVCCLAFILSAYLVILVLSSEEYFVLQKVVSLVTFGILNISVTYLMVELTKDI